jgi:nucleoside phosphorylase
MVDYNLLGTIVAIFWDENDNFNNTNTQLKIGRELFKAVHAVHTIDDFRNVLNSYPDNNQKFLLFVHVFHNEQRKGYYTFRNSKMMAVYENLNVYYISSAPKNNVQFGDQAATVYSYDAYHDLVGTVFKPQTKGTILGLPFGDSAKAGGASAISTGRQGYEKVEYALITAMFAAEFEQVQDFFDWDGDIKTNTQLFRLGHLKGRPDKKVVAAIPAATGMVDAAITATLLLELFKPTFLLMCGVCGGKKGTSLGDIIVAKKIFTFQKGKVDDFKEPDGGGLKLFNREKQPINSGEIYDSKGDRIEIGIEKFEIEHDSIIEIDSLLQGVIEPHFEDITAKINKEFKVFNRSVNVHFDSMACSTMVINKEGFFEERIKTVDRKTVAVEMESYAVARAAKYANNGMTKFLIVKSVMDNMTKKDDNSKLLAARSSALFLKYLIYDGILDKVKASAG